MTPWIVVEPPESQHYSCAMEMHRRSARTGGSTSGKFCRADGRRGSIRPGEDRTRSRICVQEGAGALLADDADGDRERCRRGGARTDHGGIGELVGACSGLRIEDVMETPGRLE